MSGISVAFLILYADDILLIGNDTEFLNSIKGYLDKNFSMEDLDEAAYILGIKIYRDRSRRLIGLSQSTYLDKVLKSTKDMFLVYGGDKELVVNGYVDASFDTDPDDSKSQSGYIFLLNGGAISWCNSKQSVMA